MDGLPQDVVRGEVEAIVAFQSALNRIALAADEHAVREWAGPRPDDVDGLAGEDGVFSEDELEALRYRAADALVHRLEEVLAATRELRSLRELLGQALKKATGGMVTLEGGAEASGVLTALTRTGALRKDWVEEALALVRDTLATVPGAPFSSVTPVPEAIPAPRGAATRPDRPAVVRKPAAKKTPSARPKASTKRTTAKARTGSKAPPSRKGPRRPTR